MSKNTIQLNVETNGLEELTNQVEELSDAFQMFSPQVTIKNSTYCTFNIYPSQTHIVTQEGEDTP